MKREIKFRGKTKDGYWAKGDLLTNHPHHGTAILENGCINYAVDPETIGQFTGLKDKNGKEVYEGDIVQPYREGHKFKNDICFIKYDERAFIMATDKEDTYINCIWFYDFEVIGNIHDNPEYLK